jgi:hypothetical protein
MRANFLLSRSRDDETQTSAERKNASGDQSLLTSAPTIPDEGSKTISAVVSRGELSQGQIDEMYSLLAAHFEGVTHAQFDRDLLGKSHAILLTRDERLVGFSTLLAYESEFEQAPVSVVYSGDTIVAPEAWGTTALSRAWIAAVNRLRETVPHGRYYWLLLTSGFRTYRFLPVFWREFFPCVKRTTPPESQQLLHHLAAERFGSQYDPASGLVRFTHPQRLRAGLDWIPEGRLASDPHVNFFVRRNPGFSQGDELVCLTELSPENLTAAGRRMVVPIRRELDCSHC